MASVVLVSQTGNNVPVPDKCIEHMKTVKNMISDMGIDGEQYLPVPEPTEAIELLVKFLDNYDTLPFDGEHCKFKGNFFQDVPFQTLSYFFNVADFLACELGLVHAGKHIADRLNNKSVADIRKVCAIEDDFTKEENENDRVMQKVQKLLDDAEHASLKQQTNSDGADKMEQD